MERKIIVTEDNSKTLLIPELNETYHSTKGALTEALHVFIKEGIDYTNKTSLRIFEMGMGTGLNALLTLNHSIQNNINIEYTTIEKYPLSFQQVEELNHLNISNLDHLQNEYRKMHECEFGTKTIIQQNFSFTKLKGDVENFNFSEQSFDLIFYDAFGPKVQSDLWQTPILERMKDLLDIGGILTTYCAQGQFKRNLKALDFEIQSIAGPPGKREMTRAIKR